MVERPPRWLGVVFLAVPENHFELGCLPLHRKLWKSSSLPSTMPYQLPSLRLSNGQLHSAGRSI